MTVEKANLSDTYEDLCNKLQHIYTVGCLLVSGCEPPASGAGDMVLELAKEAQALVRQISGKGG